MISALVLAAALTGQVTAYDGPPRQWVRGVVNGQAQWLWGWQDASGWVRFHKPENPQLFPEYRPAATVTPAKPSGVTLGAGMVLEANGTINNGLQMQGTRPTGMIDTNDPSLGSKLAIGEDCPDGRCPNDEPDLPATKSTDINTWLIVGGAAIIIVILLKK